LNTINAVERAAKDLRNLYGDAKAQSMLGKVTVVSMGTAEHGWPSGPRYVQYTNSSDPVPNTIRTAQTLGKNPLEQYRLFKDPPNLTRFPFNNYKPKPNPDATETWPWHSIDNVYIKEFESRQPSKGRSPDGSCC
jgi:hypothetical protein